MAIQIQNIETAIRIFYERFELSNKDIKNLFGITGSTTVTKLKNQALQRMAEKGKQPWSKDCVNTECAYEAWGLDINELERRYEKLNKLFSKDETIHRNVE